MRKEGTLSTWKDDKGFGFITPADGGADIFVHAKEFVNGTRRPVINDRVNYLTKNAQDGRIQATNVLFHGEIPDILTPVHVSSAIALAFFCYLGWRSFQGSMPSYVFDVYLVMSCFTALIYYLDKSLAKKTEQRVPENQLHSLEFLCGWPGALVAQQAFHHKSAKTSYQLVFWLCVIANCAILTWAY